MIKTGRKIDTKTLGLDLGVNFVRFLTGKEHLHYGIWKEGIEVCAGNLLQAQELYTERLISHLPDGEHLSILDVGGGAGETALTLSKFGHNLEIVVPSPPLAKRCEAKMGQGTPVHNLGFEEYETNRQFDVCLFSESFQYIPLEVSLRKARKVTRQGGLILISDCFRTPEGQQMKLKYRPVGGGHAITRFHEEVEKAGLEIAFMDDITDKVAPSIDLESELNKFIGSSIFRIDRELKDKNPLIRGTMATIFRLLTRDKSRDKLKERLEGHLRNKVEFCKYNCYLMIGMVNPQ